MFEKCFENLKKKQPVIHCITNYVTANDVANAILACKARPIMSDEPEEVSEITSISSGLNLNIGTLNKQTIKSMLIAGKKAKELGNAILLDPVGVGASSLRTDTAKKIINDIQPDVIKGNISEIKILANGTGKTRGVDGKEEDAVTRENLDETIKFMKSFSKKTGSVIVSTGKIDLVCDKDRCFVIKNGKSAMSSVTGIGCQLSGIITSFIAANEDNTLESAACAVLMMGIAGEIAHKKMQPEDGNSTYRNRIIDAIYNMDEETLMRYANYEVM